jgi:hypothetical protein
MEVIGIVQMVLSAIFAIAGWFIKLLWSGHSESKREIEMLKLKLAEDYVKRDDFYEVVREFKQDLKESIAPLCDKITKIDDWVRNDSKPRGQ